MSQQLTLNLNLQDGFRFESFYIKKDNADIVNLLQSLSSTNTSPLSHELQQVFLWGSEQSGKSHLLQACCYQAAKNGKKINYLPMKAMKAYGTEMLTGFDQAEILLIDDLHEVIGGGDESLNKALNKALNKEWETFFFHLINRARQNQQKLVFSAQMNPRQMHCILPDLASRLIWGAVYQLHGLQDQEMFSALRLRARQRGFEIQERVIDYLYKRYPRKLAYLMELLETLDKESLRAGKKITVPFVKSVLDNVSIEGEHK
jgi:DnaA family protein